MTVTRLLMDAGNACVAAIPPQPLLIAQCSRHHGCYCVRQHTRISLLSPLSSLLYYTRYMISSQALPSPELPPYSPHHLFLISSTPIKLPPDISIETCRMLSHAPHLFLISSHLSMTCWYHDASAIAAMSGTLAWPFRYTHPTVSSL